MHPICLTYPYNPSANSHQASLANAKYGDESLKEMQMFIFRCDNSQGLNPHFGNCFHTTIIQAALKELRRIIKSGFFTFATH